MPSVFLPLPLNLANSLSLATISSSTSTSNFGGKKQEVFLAVLLDNKNRIIKIESDVSAGSLTSSIVHPREAFKAAIKESAASVIFVHNHPSGDPEPSKEDIQITNRLVEAGNIVGIKILDHIIVGNEQYVSFKDRGIMT